MKCEICKKTTANGFILNDLCRESEEHMVYDGMASASFICSDKKLEKRYEKWLEKE